jgi:hypothetical protein
MEISRIEVTTLEMVIKSCGAFALSHRSNIYVRPAGGWVIVMNCPADLSFSKYYTKVLDCELLTLL